jgi:hypothetical protein
MDHQAFAQLLGNYGEFVGAIAVVVTLAYLAVQVRHGKQLLETNRNIALGQISQTNAGFRLGVQQRLAEPKVIALREKIEQGSAVYSDAHKENFDQLSDEEKILWRSVQAQFAIMHDDGLFQASLGLVDDKTREILEQGVRQSMPYWEYFDNYVPTRLKNWYDQQ